MKTTFDYEYPFSPVFDREFLMEMYDQDLDTVAQIFQSSCLQIAEEASHFLSLAQQGQLQELKRKVHLVKPLWGYCGIPEIQEKFQELENFLGATPTINETIIRLEGEMPLIEKTVLLIEKEGNSIQEYLKQ